MIYTCCDEKRRDALRGHPDLNGIDTLEVSDDQVTLQVTFINPLTGAALAPANIRIEGGTRYRTIVVLDVSTGAGDQARVLTVTVQQPGDFSRYTFRLVQAADSPQPPSGYDPRLAAIEFSFKVTCASDFDCQPEPVRAAAALVEPEIDYLAKDYASFRQLLLDRLTLVAPQWMERNPADLGVTLVELLAYVGDYLSYEQDAVATEAYLTTARRRVSVRRHARLVDYFMHDGCNARVWVCLKVAADTENVVLRPAGPTGVRTSLLTRCTEGRVLDAALVPGLVAQYHPEVFELLHDVPLYFAHNQIEFYTWGDERCTLRQGATQATLRDRADLRLRLRAGDILVLEEQVGPRSGRTADADPTHRHAVRLTRVHPAALVPDDDDPFTRTPGEIVTDPLTGEAIVEIEWSGADALPFDLCLSAPGVPNVAVAHGNVVLADHGRTITEPDLGPVPSPQLAWMPAGGDACQEPVSQPVPPRFRPRLKGRPLTQAAIIRKTERRNGQIVRLVLPFDPDQPAAGALRWDMTGVLPAIHLTDEAGRTWAARRDLLSSAKSDRDFVVETEEDGSAYLRFGDGEKHGARPQTGARFTAIYRVGNGVRGNIGAEALWHIAGDDPALAAVEAVRNPFPAQGGAEPERPEDVRQRAPAAFRVQERAVTPDDYAEVAARHPQVQRAAATLRWTGSWRTVFLTVDRTNGQPVDEAFRAELRSHLGRYRLAGYDLEIDGPRYVSLDIALTVRVRPDHFRSRVKAALLDICSTRELPGGRRGIFHPDSFTFGQPVYLSVLYAAAQAVEGVDAVRVTTFQRQGFPSRQGLDDGRLTMGRLEIARLDNDPNFPEHGLFQLTLEGGK